MFVHLYITRKILKVEMYDDKYMFLAFFVVLGISAVFMALYEFYLIRYIVLALVIIVYYFTNRNMIRKVIRTRLKKKA